MYVGNAVSKEITALGCWFSGRVGVIVVAVACVPLLQSPSSRLSPSCLRFLPFVFVIVFVSVLASLSLQLFFIFLSANNNLFLLIKLLFGCFFFLLRPSLLSKYQMALESREFPRWWKFPRRLARRYGGRIEAIAPACRACRPMLVSCHSFRGGRIFPWIKMHTA